MGGVPTPLEPAPATLADGRELWLKREDEHELGAFKWRGALPVIESLAAADHHTVVTASTGNHGALDETAQRELVSSFGSANWTDRTWRWRLSILRAWLVATGQVQSRRGGLVRVP